MRPLVLDGPRGTLSQLTFVPLAPLVEVLENRCFTTPHDGRRRRSRGSHGRLGPAHSDRVVGSRESDDSQNGAGLVAVASANLGGSGHCEWPSVVSVWSRVGFRARWQQAGAICSTLLAFWTNSGEFRPGNHQSLELESQQIGREKGPHAIMFHCQAGICIAVSCRFSLCAVELPASCAGAAVRAPASHGPTSPSSAPPR